jgi:hypothetical protein
LVRRPSVAFIQIVKRSSTALVDRLRATMDIFRGGAGVSLNQAANRRDSGNKESDQNLHNLA